MFFDGREQGVGGFSFAVVVDYFGLWGAHIVVVIVVVVVMLFYVCGFLMCAYVGFNKWFVLILRCLSDGDQMGAGRMKHWFSYTRFMRLFRKIQ